MSDHPNMSDAVGALRLPALINALPDEFAILDRNGVVVAANDAWRQFSIENGGEADHYIGSRYFEICDSAEGASSAEARIVVDGLRKTLATGQPFVCEYPCDSDTVKRWFELTATRIESNDDVFLAVQHRNVTARRVQRTALEQAYIDSSALAALVTGTTDPILSYDLDGNIATWNPAAEKLYGYTHDEAVGQPLSLLYPPDWPKPVSWYRDEILAGRLERFEATRIGKDGTTHEVWISCAPIRSAAGEVVAISNIHRDITELRKAEKARELLAREVIHRAKNMLTIVSAVQRQTARTALSVEDFHRSFGARIAALAKSTDLLVGGEWSAVPLGALIDGHLRPFVADTDHRIRLDGPDVRLAPQAVQTIGVAFHELATNSLKYGALHHDVGEIDISWALSPDATDKAITLSWRETKLAQPPRESDTGFGSTVLTSLAPSMLGTKADYSLTDEAVHWHISIPEAHFTLDM